MADLLDHHVESLAASLGFRLEPPVQLEEIARAMGVNEIRYVRLLEEGRVERSETTTRVLLRDGAPPTRRRFTLAHELGHLAFAADAGPLVARRTASFTTEERFCDSFAAALLMPARWLESRYRGRAVTLDLVREIAGMCGSSLAATVVRGNELFGWRRGLIRWRADSDGTWRLASVAGMPAGIRGVLRSTSSTRAVLADLDLGSTAQRMLPLGIGDTEHAFPTEAWVSPRGKVAVALISALCSFRPQGA